MLYVVFNMSTIGSWGFPVVVGSMWNALPDDVVLASPIDSLRQLKDFL